LQLGLLLAAGTAVFFLFRHVDWRATEGYLGHLGVRALLVPVPTFFILLSDTIAWRATFEHPSRFPLAPLWRVRAAVDAVTGSVPGGLAVGESIRVLLLGRRFKVPMTEAASNAVVSKLVMAASQGLFLMVGVATASLLPRTLSGSGVLAEVAAALAFSGVMGGALLAVSRGRLFTRLLAGMQKLGGPRWQAKLVRFDEPIARLDRAFATLARVPRRQLVLALAMFFVGWMCLGLEGWLILRLLDARVSVSTAISVEAIASMVRIGFFFLPGGLGAQEASYYELLRLYGVPNAEAVAAAFVITKRAKEIIWIALGYLLLLRRPT
jgi:uncharacterized membrane protein YbhN (UPF0104 family)